MDPRPEWHAALPGDSQEAKAYFVNFCDGAIQAADAIISFKKRKGFFDHAAVSRLCKRLRAVQDLRLEFSTAQLQSLFPVFCELAISYDYQELSRHTTMLTWLTSILTQMKGRDVKPTDMGALSWKALLQILQANHLSHHNPLTRASAGHVNAHSDALINCIRAYSAFYPPSAVGEILALVTPGLMAYNTNAFYTSAFFLWVFMPIRLRISQLPAGTLQLWLRCWSMIDGCEPWEGIWSSLFYRLVNPARIQEEEDEGTGEGLADGDKRPPFRWAAMIPFVAERLVRALRLPVDGTGAASRDGCLDHIKHILDGCGLPRADQSLPRLLVRLLLCKVPASIASKFGDAKATTAAEEASDEAMSNSPFKQLAESLKPLLTGTAAKKQGAGDEGAGTDNDTASLSAAPIDPVIESTTWVGDATAMGTLERLLRFLKPFFHPTSRYSGTVQTLLFNVIKEFSDLYAFRLGDQQAKAVLQHMKLGASGVEVDADAIDETIYFLGDKPHYKISHATAGRIDRHTQIPSHLVKRLVDATLPLALTGLYTEYGAQRNAAASFDNSLAVINRTFRHLISFAPALTCKEIVNMARAALDPSNTTAVHLTPNSLDILSNVVPMLTYPVPHIVPHLPQLLHLALPGIDANDNRKTQSTLRFFTTVASTLNFIDAEDISNAAAHAKAAVSGERDPNKGETDELWLPHWHPASPGYAFGASTTVVGDKPFYPVGVVGVGDSKERLGMDSAEAGFFNGDSAPGSTPSSGAQASKSYRSATYYRVKDTAVKEVFFAAREVLPALSEWALLALDAIFHLLENREKPSEEKAGGILGRKPVDHMATFLLAFLEPLFVRSSPSVKRSFVQRVQNWLAGVSCLDSIKGVTFMLYALARAAPELTLAKIGEPLLKAAQVEADAIFKKAAQGSNASSDPTLMIWNIKLLTAIAKGVSGAGKGADDIDGNLLLSAASSGANGATYIDRLLHIVRSCFAMPSAPTAGDEGAGAAATATGAGGGQGAHKLKKVGGKLLRHLILGMLSIRAHPSSLMGHSMSYFDASDADTLWTRLRLPGSGYALPVDATRERTSARDSIVQDAVDRFKPPPFKVAWSRPTEQRRAAALALLQEFMLPQVSLLKKMGTFILDGSAAAGIAAIPSQEAARNALILLMNCVRGAAPSLTDAVDPNGDEGIFPTGTSKGQALVWDESGDAANIRYATQADVTAASTKVWSLRQTTVAALASLSAALGLLASPAPAAITSAFAAASLMASKVPAGSSSAAEGLARDAKVLNLLMKLGMKMAMNRGPRLSTATQDMKRLTQRHDNTVDPFMVDLLARVRKELVKAFSRTSAATALSEGDVRSLLSGIYNPEDSYTFLARLQCRLNHTQGFALYVVPRHLHFGRYDGGGDSDGMASEEDAVEEEAQEAVEGELSAGGELLDSPNSQPLSPRLGTSASNLVPVPVDLSPISDIFGLPAGGIANSSIPQQQAPGARVDDFGLGKITALELPYFLLLGALARLSESAYTRLGGKATVGTRGILTTFPWFGKPLGAGALKRMEALIAHMANAGASSGASAAATAPAGSPEPDAAEGAAAVAGSLSAGGIVIPPAVLASLPPQMRAAAASMPPAALQSLLSSLPPGVLAAASAGTSVLTSSSGSSSSSSTGPVTWHCFTGIVTMLTSNSGHVTGHQELLHRATMAMLRSSRVIGTLPQEHQQNLQSLIFAPLATAAVSNHKERIYHPADRSMFGGGGSNGPTTKLESWNATRRRIIDDTLALLYYRPSAGAPVASGGNPHNVLNADGSRSPELMPAFWPSRCKQHWTAEATAAMLVYSILGSPAPSSAVLPQFAPEGSVAAGSSTPTMVIKKHGQDTILEGVPEEVWLWACHLVRSDTDVLRAVGAAMLLRLLYNRNYTRALDASTVGALPAVEKLFADPLFVSQLSMALVALHHAAGQGAGGGGGTLQALLQRRSPLAGIFSQGGAGQERIAGGWGEHGRKGVLWFSPVRVTSTLELSGASEAVVTHSLLVDLAVTEFPSSFAAFLKAAKQLSPLKRDTAGAAPTMELEQPTVSDSSNHHDAATEKLRSVTTAEIATGLLRAVLTAPVASAGVGDVRLHLQPSDAKTTPSAHGSAPSSVKEAVVQRVLETCVLPIIDAAPNTYMEGWSMLLNYLIQQVSAVDMLSVLRFVFASAQQALGCLNGPVSSTSPNGSLRLRMAPASLLPAYASPKVVESLLKATLDGLNKSLALGSMAPLLDLHPIAPAATAGSSAPSAPSPLASSSTSFAALSKYLDLCGDLLVSVISNTALPMAATGAHSASSSRSPTSSSLAIDATSFRDLAVHSRLSGEQLGQIASALSVAPPAVADAPKTQLAGDVSVLTPQAVSLYLSAQLIPACVTSMGHRYRDCRVSIGRFLSCAAAIAMSGKEAGLRADHVVARLLAKTPSAVALRGESPNDVFFGSMPAFFASIVHVGGASAREPGIGPLAASGEAPAEVGSGDGSGKADPNGEHALECMLGMVPLGLEVDPFFGAAWFLALAPSCLTSQQHPNKELAAAAVATERSSASRVNLKTPAMRDLGLGDMGSFPAQVFAITKDALDVAEKDGASSSSFLSEPHPWYPAQKASGSLDVAEAVLQLSEHLISSSLVSAASAVPSPRTEAGAAATGSAEADDTAAGSSGRGWGVRLAIFRLTSPIRSRAFMGSSSSLSQHFLRMYVSSLADPNVSAAQMAATCLLGVVYPQPEALQRELGDVFIHAAGAAKLPKKVNPPVSFAAASAAEIDEYKAYKKRQSRQLRKRLAGVLGACTLVRSHPADVPSFLPPLLSALARFANDPQPISGITRTAFGDFKRDHSTDWELHKLAFTPEQLSDIADVTVGTSCFV